MFDRLGMGIAAAATAMAANFGEVAPISKPDVPPTKSKHKEQSQKRFRVMHAPVRPGLHDQTREAARRLRQRAALEAKKALQTESRSL